jgi:HTH-type transcriptional regulator/antitoxin HigA
LKEIDGLMDAKPNTSAGRRLDVLARLVDAYESRHYPIEPPNRAAALQFHAETRRTPQARGKRANQAEGAGRKTGRHR